MVEGFSEVDVFGDDFFGDDFLVSVGVTLGTVYFLLLLFVLLDVLVVVSSPKIL